MLLSCYEYRTIHGSLWQIHHEHFYGDLHSREEPKFQTSVIPCDVSGERHVARMKCCAGDHLTLLDIFPPCCRIDPLHEIITRMEYCLKTAQSAVYLSSGAAIHDGHTLKDPVALALNLVPYITIYILLRKTKYHTLSYTL